MKRLNEWLAREVRSQQRHPRLDHALLTDRSFGYVAYRLRWMWIRVFVRCAVHVAELMLLSMALPDVWLPVFIGYRTMAGLVSSLYWGVLEQLRVGVSGYVRKNHFGSARLLVHNWLRISALVGVLGMAAFAAWIPLAPRVFSEMQFFHLYGGLCFARLAFDLWARTLHSGIFAIKRVYRPAWSLLLPEVVELVVLIVAFPSLSLLAFALMVVIGGVVRIGLSNHFAKRAYRSSRIEVPSFRGALFGRNLVTLADVGNALKLGVSNATSQLDGLIILLLLIAGAPQDGPSATFASVYYVLRPLMAVAHGWARVFYFDFKRLDASVDLFRRRFRSLLTRAAIALAAVVAALVLVATTILSRGMPDVALLCLVPVFVARSLMSLRQLEAFTSGAHTALLRVSLGLLAAIGLVAWLTRNQVTVMLAASVLLLCAYWLLPTQDERVPSLNVCGLPRWVARVSAMTVPVRISVLTIDRELTTAARFMHRFSSVLESGVLTRFGRSHVLVLETIATSKLGSAGDVAHLSEGTLSEYRWITGNDGPTVLKNAIAKDVLPRDLLRALATEAPSDLVASYRTHHASGTVLDAKSGRVENGKALHPRELRAIMQAVAVQSRGTPARASHQLDVLVYAPGGEPETIFITPSAERPSLEFRRRVQAASLQASLRDKRTVEAASTA